MAGLDQPSAGRIFENSVDITGVDVRKHNVAMVYQQFINYPAATVFENIASPIRVAGKLSRTKREARVRDIAGRLGLTPLLDRLPAQISGGQQQRCALARAQDCTLPAGTPVVQCLPVRREVLDLQFYVLEGPTAATYVEVGERILAEPGVYRKNFRHKG